MDKGYVKKLNGRYRIAGSRVSLESVVYDFLSGLSPEGIVENFGTLSLEQVYGAITYYLAHRVEIDGYLKENRVRFNALRRRARDEHPLLYRKLESLQQVKS